MAQISIKQSVPIRSLGYVLTFGKYKDWTIEQVLEQEPGYINWCVDNRIFVLDDDADEALVEAINEYYSHLRGAIE